MASRNGLFVPSWNSRVHHSPPAEPPSPSWTTLSRTRLTFLIAPAVHPIPMRHPTSSLLLRSRAS
eukprot:1369970-Pleurochrysis_carterae.AAC.1